MQWFGQCRVILAVLICGAVIAGCESRAELAPRKATPREAGEVRAKPAPDSSLAESAEADQPQNASMAALEEEVLKRVNQARQGQGLKPLRIHPQLTSLARGFSRRMAVEDFFSHESPEGETFEQRVRGARLEFTRIGENIYKCYNTPRPAESAVKAWMESPGHRHNILTAEYTETGIGVWKKGKNLYFTQDFIRPR